MERKTLYDISWKVSENKYREDPAYSYSTIARFNREGFNKLDKLFDRIETPSLLFGSIVDTLLTDGQEEFEKRFEVADLPNISDNLVQIATQLFNEFNTVYRSLDKIPDESIARIGKDCDYYAADKWKALRVKKIKENCGDYYSMLYLRGDKTLVSSGLYQTAQECVERLRNDDMTSFYFAPNNPFDNDIERFYQLKFKGVWEGIKLRCMADLIIVDHKNKIITPCDLKTSSHNEWDFFKSFIDWCYFIQAQLYWFLIRQNMDKDPVYKDYKLANYKFIVVNRFNKRPLVWEYEDTQCTIDKYYGKNSQIFCRNWRNIVKDLDYYLSSRPNYPIGINKVNSITEWLNKE